MKHIHFIGICGAGMAAVACMMKDSGYIVTGSDDGFYDPIKSYLDNHGFALQAGHSPENIPLVVDTIVIGKHAKLVPESNTEVAHAYKLRDAGSVRIVSMPELLGEITKDRTSVVVAGSFGKSTCAALLSWVLRQSGRDIGYFIGAQVHGFADSCRLGTDLFIFEGDEYPSSNWDNRSKFEHYHADHLLVTSLEHDHVNFFLTHEDYLVPFRKLASVVPVTGSAVVCVENISTGEIVSRVTDCVNYGAKTGDWHARNIIYSMNSVFDLYCKDKYITTIQTQLLGEHNIQNIVGVSAVILSHGWATVEQLQSAVASFAGVRRRLDKISKENAVPIYEGFGSSYAKAVSALNAMRLHFPNSQILTIFEPHTFSWRDPKTAFWYHDVFREAQSLILTIPPESHGKSVTDQLSSQDILDAIQSKHDYVICSNNTSDICHMAQEFCDSNTSPVVLLLSSGELLQLPKILPGFLKPL